MPWRGRYAAALGAFLAAGGERELETAYELGREALRAGHGLVALVAAHHEIAARGWTSQPPADPAAALARAGAFLDEAVSAYEMTHRGFGDARLALRRMHEFVEREARRIARAVHDGAAQSLAALHLQLDDLARDLPPAGRGRVLAIRRALDQIEEELRDIAHELRPAVLDDLGLSAALTALAETFTRRTGIPVACHCRQPRRWPAAVETALYRAAQEALTNIRRHAAARTVTLRLQAAGFRAVCRIEDDGAGFDPARAAGDGLGLPSMVERVRSLGGTVEIRSAPGRGARIVLSVPLDPPHAQSHPHR